MTGPRSSLEAATRIAVVGMACRFPGARNPRDFWRNLRGGVESIEDYSDEALRAAGVDEELIRHPRYVKRGATIEGMENWDHEFFGFSPADAAIMDPQHRHFLEVAWEAFENAGYVPGTFPGPVGVFAGSGANSYLMFNLLTNPELVKDRGIFLLRHTGNDKDFLATRASYHFDLTGPAVNVQTACSTSLVAIHLACQSLLSFECDMALAGGVTIRQPHRHGYLYQPGEILSPDGRCRAFDARAEGTVIGDGVGTVVLRRLDEAIEDGDHVLAVIRGSAVNNDGSGKAGYLAPGPDGQAKAIAEALAVSGVEPDTIEYVEGHSTGTPIGDPVEVGALQQAFRSGTDRVGFCGLGSVKSNIGHLDTAAGVAGFIKAVLALYHEEIPATLHFESPNPELRLEGSPFYVVSERRRWPRSSTPRRAGVSSLGVGGTNAHVILEEPPVRRPSSRSRSVQILLVSGRSRAALDRSANRLVEHLESPSRPSLADVAYTLQVGRRAFRKRRFVVCRSPEEAIDALVAGDPGGPVPDTHAGGDGPAEAVAFLFAGGGSQQPGMAAQLYREEGVFRDAIDPGLRLLPSPLRSRVRALLFPEAGKETPSAESERPSVALPALFLVQYALTRLWEAWGVRPAALIGHSLGEATAACIAGILDFEEALEIAVLRGELFERMPPGGMLSVGLSEKDLAPLLDEELSLAAVNGPELCVASGPERLIRALDDKLQREGIATRRTRIGVAAHGSLLDPVLADFRERFRAASLRPPEIPFVSNLTGRWMTDREATDPEYWVRQIREPVRFHEGLRQLFAEPTPILLEVGVGRTLASLARAHPERPARQEVLASLPGRDGDSVPEVESLLGTLGRLWQLGVPIDWRSFHAQEARSRVPLPTYPFESVPHYIEPGAVRVGAVRTPTEPSSAVTIEEDPEAWLHHPVWRRAPAGDAAEGGAPSDRNVLVLAGEEGSLSHRIAASLQARGIRTVNVRPGADCREDEEGFQLRYDVATDYDALLEKLDRAGRFPSDVLHLRALDLADENRREAADLAVEEEASFYSLLFLAQAVGRRLPARELRLQVVTDRAHRVAGEGALRPMGALVAGPIRVIPREIEAVRTRWIDIAVPPHDPTGSAPEWLLDDLVREVYGDSDDQVVALRDGDRWLPTFEKLALPPPRRTAAALPPRAVCLITGGFGAIGLAVAGDLARSHRARLVLVGRTGLPPRARWTELLASFSSSDRTVAAIRAILAMEAAGAEVLALTADLTDEARMRDVIAEAQARFGKIDLVLHAAGVLDDGPIQWKEAPSAAAVLAPKVKGTRVLEKVLAEAPPERLVLFSSRSAISGIEGQVDYTSANAFLDAVAADHRARRWGNTISIDWSMWSGTGMAARVGPERSRLPTDRSEKGWERTTHPIFQIRQERDGELRLRVPFELGRFWFLDEHRTRGGAALVPGTGYLELIRSGLQEMGWEGPLSLADVQLLRPFMVAEGRTREMEIRLCRQEAGGRFTILGRRPEPEGWEELVHGRFGRPEASPSSPMEVEQIESRCSERAVDPTPLGERTDLDLGSRWACFRKARYGSGEALLDLELPSALAGDLDIHPLHPALMDIATAGAKGLIPGFREGRDYFVPASYGSVVIHRPLPRKLYSHVRIDAKATEGDIAVFDATLVDEEGRPLVEVREFIMLRVSHTDVLTRDESAAGPDTSSPLPLDRVAQDDRGADQAIAGELHPERAIAVLYRILESVVPPQVIVSPVDLDRHLAEVEAASIRRLAGGERRRSHGAGAPEVDLSPVEEALVAEAAIVEAAVTAHRDGPSELRLVAHIVFDPSRFMTVSELRKSLRTRLPSELLPRNFVQLPALPRTDDGAIDRARLLDPLAPEDDHVPPSTPVEAMLAGIWQDLLGTERIGIHDNFLDAGGHSLLAVRAILRIEKETGVRLSPSMLNLQTLEQIASHIQESEGPDRDRSRGWDESDGSGDDAEGAREKKLTFASAVRMLVSGVR